MFKRKLIRVLLAAAIGFGIVGLAANFANAATTDPRIPSDIEDYAAIGTQPVGCKNGRSFLAVAYVDPALEALKYIILLERVGISVEVRVVIEMIKFVSGMDAEGEITETDGTDIRVYVEQVEHPIETYDSSEAFDKKYPTACTLPQALAVDQSSKQSSLREF